MSALYLYKPYYIKLYIKSKSFYHHITALQWHFGQIPLIKETSCLYKA